jgi:hypothetical protein
MLSSSSGSKNWREDAATIHSHGDTVRRYNQLREGKKEILSGTIARRTNYTLLVVRPPHALETSGYAPLTLCPCLTVLISDFIMICPETKVVH